MCRVDHPRPRRRAPAAARPRCPGPRRARRHAGGALCPGEFVYMLVESAN